MPSWWDRFGQEWGRLGLVDDPTDAQSDAGFAFIGQAPPTVELFNSMFQWNDDKDNWLFGQIANVIRADNVLPDPLDLLQLLRALDRRQKLLLTGPTTFYCDAINGNDSTGNGTQATPWRTIYRGIQWILTYVEPANNTCVIQLAPGTYEPFSVSTSMNGNIVVQGDVLNPRAYTIRNTNGVCAYASQGAVLYVQGISFEAAGADTCFNTSGTALIGDRSGIVLFADVAFGPCSNVHMWGASGGRCHIWYEGANYTIYGGGRAHMCSSNAGDCTNVRGHCTIQNNPNFTIGFAYAAAVGGIQTWYSTYSGTAQGVRAYIVGNSVLNNAGVDPNVSLPGTLPAVYGAGGLFF